MPQSILKYMVFMGISFVSGMGVFLLWQSKALSYLSDNPAACANCHVMEIHYQRYLSTAHSRYATCNDCHTPPSSIRKILTKIKNGISHSYAFTTGNYREPLLITHFNQRVVEENCYVCHQNLFFSHPISQSCLLCHKSLGHS
ncbi:MAG: NapC/NirT family cytochrome c [Leptospiraceae bacterium]|nr:NapC/NirT family cytochrome c [Leptospiraceae bacterium]MDW8306496.1 NapC/NirT family cytochrome c [Leptospiraceae bacterium]